MDIVKVRIEDYCDGFAVILIDKDGLEERFRFDQEDTREELVAAFKKLGIKAEYKEIY
jgi:hypothetical protein